MSTAASSSGILGVGRTFVVNIEFFGSGISIIPAYTATGSTGEWPEPLVAVSSGPGHERAPDFWP